MTLKDSTVEARCDMVVLVGNRGEALLIVDYGDETKHTAVVRCCV